MGMFLFMYNQLKTRIVLFSLPQSEPFIITKGVGPLPLSPTCCTTMFPQKSITDKLYNGSEKDIMHFSGLSHPL